MNERIRFAPSPTGFLHVGGLRTALYGYLVARKSKGSFILRIEDTDRKRYVEEAEQDISKTLEDLGILPDEGPTQGGEAGPYRQSERLDFYASFADKLLKKKAAYRQGGALRFTMPSTGSTSYTDLIRGSIKFENKLEEDFVIIKSDGFPTYNFANVVDDHLMGITTVIRGEEFISSMPKHLKLYEALGLRPPRFAHLPLILGADKKKLSKRTGDVAVSDYLGKGYLREAILNFLVLLGWHPRGDKEFLSAAEMIEEFALERVQSSPAVFDVAKLDWLNKEWIKHLAPGELYLRAREFGAGKLDEKTGVKLLALMRDRITRLDQVEELGYFLLADKFVVSRETSKDVEKKHIKIALEALPKAKPWKADALERWGRQLALSSGLAPGKLFMSLRITVLGKRVSPPLFESMELLGAERVKERLLSYN